MSRFDALSQKSGQGKLTKDDFQPDPGDPPPDPIE